MTNTINVPINTTDQWVEVATSGTSGTVGVTGSGQHCICDGIPPDTLVGHRFTGNAVPFVLGVTESLYVKSSTPTNAIVTGD